MVREGAASVGCARVGALGKVRWVVAPEIAGDSGATVGGVAMATAPGAMQAGRIIG